MCGKLFVNGADAPVQLCALAAQPGGRVLRQHKPAGFQPRKGLLFALTTCAHSQAFHAALGPFQAQRPDALAQRRILGCRYLVRHKHHALPGTGPQGGGVHFAPGRQPRQLRPQGGLTAAALLPLLRKGCNLPGNGQRPAGRQGFGLRAALFRLAKAGGTPLQRCNLLAQQRDALAAALGDFNMHKAQPSQLFQRVLLLPAQNNERHLFHGYYHCAATCLSGAGPLRAAILRFAIFERTTAFTCWSAR